MIKKIFEKLYKKQSKVLRKYLMFSFILNAIVSLTVLFVSFSVSSFLLVVSFGICSKLLFSFLEKLKEKSKFPCIRMISVSLAFALVLVSSVLFIIKTNSERGLYAVFSRKINVEDSDELLEIRNNQNISLTIQAETIFETKYLVEKVISEKGSEDSVSNAFDGDGWIDNVILDRTVLYYYCVFKFDEKYFVARISPDVLSKINDKNGKITINCLAIKPEKTDSSVCKSICEDISTIIYPVDHFEGEGEKDFYEDLEKISGEKTVMVVADDVNLLKERTYIATSVLIFLSGIFYIFLIIMNPSEKKQSLKKR